MKDIYKATNNLHTVIGTRTSIAKQIGVSRQAVHAAIINKAKCAGYEITFNHMEKPKTYETVKKRLAIAEELLKRSYLIIAENNQKLNNQGEYANVGIEEGIKRFLERRN